MRLLFYHPEVANRDCQHCLKYHYNEETGEPFRLNEQDENSPFAERHDGCKPPCQTRKGCLKGTPEKPNSLSEKNLQAYEHYLECKAVGEFPGDAIVRHNAKLIRFVEDERTRKESRDFQKLIVEIATMKING